MILIAVKDVGYIAKYPTAGWSGSHAHIWARGQKLLQKL